MRIAFVTFEYPPFIIGGAGVYALNVTHELAKLGHQIIVFVPDIPGIKYEKDLENIVFNKVKINNKLPFNALQYWLNLPAEVKKAESENKFDIIHFNGISYWFLKRRISRAPHIVTIHHLVKDAIKNNNLNLISRIKGISGENSFFMSFIEKKCIKSPDKLVTVSNFTKKQIIELYGINPDQIKTIYNGIDLNGYFYSTTEEVTKIKEQCGLVGKPVLLFVGRVDDPRKNLDFLLRTLKKIRETIDVSLLVVGKGDQTEARKLIDSLGISNSVVFTGYVDDKYLKQCYSLCDVYVCPSKLEGFGLTLIEAMALGKPIVATNVGAIPEILGDCGILVDLNNEIAFCEAIIKVLDNKNSFDHKIVTKAHNFSWGNNAKELQTLYFKGIKT